MEKKNKQIQYIKNFNYIKTYENLINFYNGQSKKRLYINWYIGRPRDCKRRIYWQLLKKVINNVGTWRTTVSIKTRVPHCWGFYKISPEKGARAPGEYKNSTLLRGTLIDRYPKMGFFGFLKRGLNPPSKSDFQKISFGPFLKINI